MRRATVSRSEALISGGVGASAGLILTVTALLLRPFITPLLPPLLQAALIAWLIFLCFLALALLEIPLMIYGLRKISERPSLQGRMVIRLGNGIFVFFPLVYALPNLMLLDARLTWLGLIISASSLVRFASSLIFLSPPRKT